MELAAHTAHQPAAEARLLAQYHCRTRLNLPIGLPECQKNNRSLSWPIVRIRLNDCCRAVVRFVGAVGTGEICYRRASPLLTFGIRHPVFLGGQQAGNRLLSACNDKVLASFKRKVWIP